MTILLAVVLIGCGLALLVWAEQIQAVMAALPPRPWLHPLDEWTTQHVYRQRAYVWWNRLFGALAVIGGLQLLAIESGPLR